MSEMWRKKISECFEEINNSQKSHEDDSLDTTDPSLEWKTKHSRVPPVQQRVPPPNQQRVPPPVQQRVPPSVQQRLPPPGQQRVPPPGQRRVPPGQRHIPPGPWHVPPDQGSCRKPCCFKGRKTKKDLEQLKVIEAIFTKSKLVRQKIDIPFSAFEGAGINPYKNRDSTKEVGTKDAEKHSAPLDEMFQKNCKVDETPEESSHSQSDSKKKRNGPVKKVTRGVSCVIVNGKLKVLGQKNDVENTVVVKSENSEASTSAN